MAAKEAYAGFTSLVNGVHGGLDPEVLKDTFYWRGINVSTRGGLVHTRPGWVKDYTGLPEDSVFQGAGVWSLNRGDWIVLVLSGVVYVYELNTGTLTNLGLQLDASASQCYFKQVDRYMVVQDGQSPAVVIEESTEAGTQYDAAVAAAKTTYDAAVATARTAYDNEAAAALAAYQVSGKGNAAWTKYVSRLSAARQAYDSQTRALLDTYTAALSAADTTYQERLTTDGTPQIRATAHSIPTGYCMAFVHGRLHVVPKYVPGTTETGRPYMLSGDIALPNDPASALQFTETEYLNEGGAHGLPMEMGYIYGMEAFRNASTGTGYGPLVVLAKRGLVAFTMDIPRDQWKEQQLAQVLFFGPGTVSPWSVIPVNNDLWYRGHEGLRSVRYTAAQLSNQALSNNPQSDEVRCYFENEGKDYLPRVSTAHANNRLFCSVGGTNSRYFKGLVSLDLSQLSSLQTDASMAYDGLWQISGTTISQVLDAYRLDVRTPYIIDSSNVIWRLDEAAVTDSGTPISCRLITRTFNYDNVDALKTLTCVQLWLADIQTNVDLTVYYRPQGYPLWNVLGSTHLEVAAGGYPQRRRGVQLCVDNTAAKCDPSLQEYLTAAQGFQFAIEWTGFMKLETFRSIVLLSAEGPAEPCPETAEDAVAITAPAGGSELGEYLT